MRLYECVWDLVVGYSKKLYTSTTAIYHLNLVNNLNLLFLFAFKLMLVDNIKYN